MSYNFDKVNDRRQSNSSKWKVAADELPMWVADMDIQTAPEIMAAMHKDVDRGIFGYQYVPDEYYQAVVSWYQNEHQTKLDPNWLTFSTGVVPVIGSIIRHLTDVGDNILLQEPNYNAFYGTITNNGRHILNSELTYQDSEYAIDWADLAEKMADPQTTAMILCNPHNPTGHIWSAADLQKIGELAQKHHVLIISDEIHGDLTVPGQDYTLFSSLGAVADNSVSLVSPSKTFNLAVLHAATIITPNAALKARVDRAISIDGLNEPGVLAISGSIAAYTQGHAWLKALKEYIAENRRYLETYAAENIPTIKVLPADATYLAWVDCTKLTHDSAAFANFLRDETGLFVAEGTKYRGNGECFLRINLATTKARVEDGVKRLEQGIAKFKVVG